MLIRGGRIIDPTRRIDALRDLRVDGERITEIAEHLSAAHGEEILDATGCIVAPGFIDIHCHLREPGFVEKESLSSGSAAAVRGGFTSICAMPNTNPALDNPDVVAWVRHERPDPQAGIHARIYPIAAITRGRAGDVLLDYDALAAAGAVAFSDDGNTVMNARVMRDAALAAAHLDRPFISHAEDENLKGNAVMHEGALSRQLGFSGSPGSAEEVIVARDLVLALEVSARWHIAHLSTARSLDLLAWARGSGARATCEVTPHHLLLTDESVAQIGARAKVNPPLRSGDDARRLRDAVRAGAIDCFATDHAPHTASEKAGDMLSAAVGFSGLEIAVGAYALAVPDLPLPAFIAMCSSNPAKIAQLPGGTLVPGSSADITVFAERAWRVDSARFASKGRSTPFDGWELPRQIIATIVAGKIAYQVR